MLFRRGCGEPLVAELTFQVINVHRRKVLHLPFGDAEPDTVAALAPGIPIVDASTGPSPAVEGPGQPPSAPELGPAD